LPRDSSDIDQAVLQRLGSDPTLLSFATNGVYMDEAPPGSKAFVIVSIVHPVDGRAFEGRSWEEVLYLVEARTLSSVPNANTNTRQAAARIDELLDPPSSAPALVVPNYTFMGLYRDEDFPRVREVEIDDHDPTIRWYRRGGHYKLIVST
jgi:hypothetical protein